MNATQSAAAALHEAVRDPIRLARFRLAREVTAAVGPRKYLHAGPPIRAQEALGPMRGALIAGLLYEHEAPDAETASHIVDSGGVDLTPCHAAGGVGALAGVVTPSTPVVVVATEGGRSAFAPLNEGLGKATRFGDFDANTLARLRWFAEVMAPALDRAVVSEAPIDLLEVQAEGLRRGDECHNRNVACSALVVSRLAAAIVATSEREVAEAVLRELASNHQFFLALSMATAKCAADRVHELGVPGIVTAIAANGRDIGIRVSGASGGWFTRQAEVGDMVLLDGFTAADACPPMGDSAVAETIGLGAFALTEAPGLARSIGLSSADARALVSGFRHICATESSRFQLPSEDYRGSPFGIEVESVMETGIVPAFTGGYAHREPGRGRVGAGLIEVPLGVFEAAVDAR